MISACNRIISRSVDALLRGRGNFDGDGVAAPRFGTQPLFLQLFLDAIGFAVGRSHLVDGDEDRDLRGFGMVDRLNRLGHDAVIGGHHQHGDIRDVGAPRPHLRECLVAGGVQERDGLAAGK
jgi:hypothetical protein